MDVLQRFLAYAADFERTLVDDDWTRLDDYFADEAVYEVRGVSFACRLEGKAAIFTGMRRSLNGFDRVFARRDVAPEGVPEVGPDRLAMGWTVTYYRDGAPPFVLRGRSEITYHDDRIVHLADTFDPAAEQAMAEWQRKTGIELNPSYT